MSMPPVDVDRGRDERDVGVEVRDVTGQEVPADLLGDRPATLLVEVGDDHLDALGGQRQRRRPAQPGGAAGDEGDLVAQLHQASSRTSLPTLSPRKSICSVSGKSSIPPLTTCSLVVTLPSAIQPAISAAASR